MSRAQIAVLWIGIAIAALVVLHPPRLGMSVLVDTTRLCAYLLMIGAATWAGMLSVKKPGG